MVAYTIPDTIFPELNIVEKEILGVKHYGIQRVYRFGRFTLKRMLKVYDGFACRYQIRHTFAQTTWFTDERVLKNAIRNDRNRRIDKYVEKHVR